MMILEHPTASALQELTRKRQEKSEAAYQQALELVGQYNQSHRPQLIKDALNQLVEAVSANRKHARAYYLMAYLYYSLRNHQLAIKYLTVAQQIQPDFAEAAALRALIAQGQQMPVLPVQAARPSFETPQSNIDFDAFYERLEDTISQQVRVAMQMQTPFEALADASLIALLDEQFNRLSGQQKNLEQQLKIVDQEIDTGPLIALMRPLELRVNQIKKLHIACLKLEAQNHKITACRQEVRRALAQVPDKDLLNQLLDNCDAIADSLDALEASGIAIASIKGNYRQLMQELNALQDQYDDEEP